MKKICAILLLFAMVLSLFSCGGAGESDGDTIWQSESESRYGDDSESRDDLGESESAESEFTESEPEEGEGKESEPVESENAEEELFEQEYPTVTKAPETLRVLSIGNSFSDDAMEYLYRIAKSAGVKTVILGNLYIGGCTLSTHLSHAKSGSDAYIYRKNTAGVWVSTEKSSFNDGLLDEDWDYITFQQASSQSGIASSYSALEELVRIVDQRKTNEDAHFFWHMTWAYQQNSTHSGFANYGRDQDEMYEKIVDTVENRILTSGLFDGIIPSGTAVQNARTSFLGDTLTRDGYHMHKTKGRYIAGLTYFAALTGADVSDVSFSPAADVTASVVYAAREAVTNALRRPFTVTDSTYLTGYVPTETDRNVVDPADCLEGDYFWASTVGVDLSGYVLLEYDYLTNTYYNSTSKTGTETPGSGGSTYQKFICTAQRYTKDQLLGAMIICDYGWQFRPELWPDATGLPSARGVNTSAGATVLDEAFWGSYTVFGMNISSNPQTKIADCYQAAASHVRIYVPAEALELLAEGE